MRQKTLVSKAKNFEEIKRFIGKTLKEESLSKRKIAEAMLVFEAIYGDIINDGPGPETPLNVNIVKRFGETFIKIGFEGKLFLPSTLTEDGQAGGFGDSPEAAIIKAFGDKVSHTYHGGYNNIIIMAQRTHSRQILLNGIALILAVAAFVITNLVGGPGIQSYMLDNFVSPLETIFTNAVLMIAAPVTFFSLLKNFTDAYVLSEKSSIVRKIQITAIMSSVTSALMAFALCMILRSVLPFARGAIADRGVANMHVTFADIIESLVPTSIFAPFESLAPFPLIVLAGLVTYALCSVGRYFDSLKRAIEICYSLFSRMLSVIMLTLPFFFFLAVMDSLLTYGSRGPVYMLVFMAAVVLSLGILFIYYSIKLKANGIGVRDFFKKLIPLWIENTRIGDPSEAIPYNVRYCANNFGISRQKAEASFPILAQVNLDGNCFIIIFVSLTYVFLTDSPLNWYEMLVIVVLAFVLSLGAPSQPGSLIVGFLIIVSYLNTYEMVSVIIFMEVFLGNFINLINVTGDIVTVSTHKDAETKQGETVA